MSRVPTSIVGFLAGIATAVLAFSVGFWYARDGGKSAPDEVPAAAIPAPATPSSATPSATVPPMHGVDPGPIDPETAAEIERLEAAVAASPDDIDAKRQLALTLVQTGRFVDAFDYSEEVLKAFPDDPDGLYIQGVVRLRMGQVAAAEELLDRVLVAHPDHIPSYIARGLASLRTGRHEEAVATWERGLAAAGGQNADLERLLLVSKVAASEKQ